MKKEKYNWLSILGHTFFGLGVLIQSFFIVMFIAITAVLIVLGYQAVFR